MRIHWSSLSCALLALAGVVSAQGANKGFWVDAEIGVKLRAPAKWAWLGDQGDLGRLRALFAAPRDYAPKVAEGAPHNPTLRVLCFPKDQPAVEATADKDALPKRTPYRDTADYLARVHGPDAKIEAQEVTKIGGLDGKHYMLKVPRAQGDLTLDVFATKTDAGEVALELEVLTEQHERVRKEAAEAFDTLAAVPIVAAAKPPAAPLWETDAAAWLKLPVADRHKQRLEWGKRWLDQRKTAVEAGWKVQLSKSFVVISRADARWVPRAAQAADQLRAWADKRLGAVSDEVVMPAVVRIFGDAREAAAFGSREVGLREYDPQTREILCWHDKDVGTGSGFGELARGVVQQYLFDKDPAVFAHLPRWLDFGLGEYLRSNRVKDKVEFFPDEVELGRFEYHAQNDSLPVIWGLIQESNPAIATQPDGKEDPIVFGYTPECARILRWLDAGASQQFGHEDFLIAYLKATAQAAAATPPDPGKDIDWLRLTPDQAKKLRIERYARRDDLLRRINDATCTLSEDKWKAINAAWAEFNKKFKG